MNRDSIVWRFVLCLTFYISFSFRLLCAQTFKLIDATTGRIGATGGNTGRSLGFGGGRTLSARADEYDIDGGFGGGGDDAYGGGSAIGDGDYDLELDAPAAPRQSSSSSRRGSSSALALMSAMGSGEYDEDEDEDADRFGGARGGLTAAQKVWIFVVVFMHGFVFDFLTHRCILISLLIIAALSCGRLGSDLGAWFLFCGCGERAAVLGRLAARARFLVCQGAARAAQAVSRYGGRM
jgi:hypothetical protein